MQDIINKYSRLPFEYGLDCCNFAAECVESITGKNPMESIRYSGEAEALALIESYGSLEAAVRSVLGDPYDGIKDGDITVHDVQDGQQTVGVVYLGRSVVRTKSGVTDWPLEWAKGIWKT